MKEAFGLLVVLLVLTALCLFWSDCFISLPDQDSEVEVVGLCFDHPSNKKTNKVLVKWNGKTVQVECNPFKAGGLKVGDKVEVEARKSWLLGVRRTPQVKED